ncbi:PH domain-containing protein [Piscibacillus sp. B03]|uniref:PH domain-containing protein n=1 Tax=Piscibacillus sp. B03 TaxID=3457430 RepID=UPI003FCC7D35
MYFPSKKDWWMGLLFFSIPVLMLIESLRTGTIDLFIVAFIIGSAFMWLWVSTGYRIENETLYVQYGPFKRKIDITKISKLKKTRSVWSAPALSLDRVEILYDRDFKIALISPRNQDQFIEALLEQNPNIQVN